MKLLSILFLTVLLISLPSCKKIKERGLFGKKANTLVLLKAQQEALRKADSLRVIQNRLKAIEEARLDSIRLAAEEKLSWEARYKYNLIVGSFLTPEYARAWSEEYRNMGYDPKIIKGDDSRFDLVAVESHESYSKAVIRLNQFQDTVNIDTWIYIKK
jgi:hypothetical protein